ncbi:MAG: NAD(P)H-hydrate epimerase [Kiritimatiellia bacterium]
MLAITTGEMRELDRRTIDEDGIPGEILMERAGIGVARALDRIVATGLLPMARSRTAIWLVAGRGNNGGDAFVAARHLYGWGYQIRVLLAGGVEDLNGDALLHLRRMRDVGIVPQELPRPEDWHEFNPAKYPELPRPAIIVDGLLGTGIQGAPRDTMAAAINFINNRRHTTRIVAIDVPSGLNADDGSAPGPAVQADITLTMACPKTGLLQGRAMDYVGNLEVLDIGIPAKFKPQRSSDLELITPADISFLAQRRSRTAHKGSFGHLVIIAGAAGFSGAAIMAAYACRRLPTATWRKNPGQPPWIKSKAPQPCWSVPESPRLPDWRRCWKTCCDKPLHH